MSKGFTLVEAIVVIAVLSIIFSLGIPVSLNMYDSYVFSTERDLLFSILSQSRSIAMTNPLGTNSGVYIDDENYTIFIGANYESRDQNQDTVLQRSNSVTIIGNNEVIFENKSGNTTNTNIILQLYEREATITTNQEGLINW